jgi:uncharacterized delta-60 repeat protein
MGRSSNRIFVAPAMLVAALVAIVGVGALAPPAGAAPHSRPGALDPSFGDGGRVLVKPPLEPTPAEFSGAGREPDGDLVLEMRHTSPSEDGVREIEMRKPSGALDPSFGQSGTVKAPPGDGMTVLPDGDILVGVVNCGGDPSSAWEIDPSGNPVAGFGTKGCAPKVGFPEKVIAVDGQGRVLLAGAVQFCGPCGKDTLPSSEPVVARLLPNGTLDPSFGKGGVVYTRSEDGLEIGYGDYSEPRVLAPTADGGLVIDFESELIRLTESGALDQGFGKAGTLSVPGMIDSILGTPDGGIVVPTDPSKGPAAVTKFGPTGAPDPSFGDAGTLRLSLPSGSRLERIAAFPEGGVLVAGVEAGGKSCRSCLTPFLTRLTAAGQPDPTYGNGGTAALAPASEPRPFNEILAVAVAADGSALVGGQRSGGDAYALLRTPTGAPEAAFAEGGALVEHHEEPAELGATGLAARAGGGIRLLTERYNDSGDRFGWLADFGAGGGQRRFAGGTSAVESSPHGSIVADGGGRFVSMETDPPRAVGSVHGIDRDGKTWKAFGKNGYTKVPPMFKAMELLPAPGGGVAIVGSFRGQEMAVLRLGPKGRPLPGFGRAGLAKVRFPGAAAVANGGVVEADGDIVLVGSAKARLAVARLLPDGRPDPSFGRGGIVRLGRGTTGDFVAPMAGGLVIATQHQKYGPPPFAGLVRLDSHGHLDRGFGKGGLARGSERLPFALLTVAGRIVLVIDPEFEKHHHHAGLELRSYLPDGRPDRAFGKDGIVYFGRGGERGITFTPAAAIASPGGKVTVAGTSRNREIQSGRHTEAELVRFLVR